MKKGKDMAQGTGQDAVAEVTMGIAPKRKRSEVEQPRLKAVPEPEFRAPDFVTTNIQLHRDQLHAIQLAAIQRARERGTVRPNHSELYREAVDLWLNRKKAGK